MAEEVGGIVYEVGIEAGGLKAGSAQVAAALEQVQKEANRTSTQLGSLDTNLSKTAVAVNNATNGTNKFRTAMQQGGYQVQDFVVQVQGGQSALVAFSQQGSQLLGIFGPGGAVAGALLTIATIIAGTLVAAMNGGKSAIESLNDAISATDKIISISSNGVAAYSDKFAMLAKANTQLATLMRQQAQLELQAALSKVSKEVTKASSDFISFGDTIVSSLSGGYASIKLFDGYMKTLNITTNDFSEAFAQASAAGESGRGVMMGLVSTVGALASRFNMTDQQAFEFAKQLSDISKNPTDEKLRALIATLQEVGNGTSKGASTAREYAQRLIEIMSASTDASIRLKALKDMTDSLTSSQDKALRQAQQTLFIEKQTGDERQKAMAWRDAENQGLKAGTAAFRQYYDVRLATYKQQEANAEAAKKEREASSAAESAAKKAANQAESNAQKIERLRQESELSADSTTEMSRAQAILNAQQSLNKGATQEDIKLAGEYAAKKWDNANAIKAEAAARKLLPETAENASYQQDLKDLQTALTAKKITQQQYDATELQLAQQHQVKLNQIRAQQSVSPIQQGVAQVNPIQALANEQVQKLALIQQYEQQRVISHETANALMAAADTEYRTNLINAQWQIWSNQSAATQAAAAAFDAFGSTAANALTGILTGSMSVSDALRSIGSNILSSVINSFVQMGIEWAKSVIMGQVGMTAAAAMSITQAQLIASAAAPAAALMSLATAGANSGPAMAGMGATVALGKTLAIAGARYNGGSVTAGSMYQVGENGLPEIFQASNGSQYMIPGDNGRVISNRDMTSGSSGVIIYNNVINNTSSQVSTSATDNGDGTVTIQTIVADIEENGPIGQAIDRNYTASRRATE